ncbi:hypothetical protein G7Y89_g1022 [Cudoniella acicularis]|uniref:NAD(P)-binding protein n=1 Tax=Cudoniella acicularis TaxID=354080 RepID=A0A8H4RWY1_9HELO|nr:hypothetical protein G7Y89_g1022 [Cudoniella acicularis]
MPYDTISPFRPELSTRGKTVFITGGCIGIGIGIGASIAKAFAQSGAAIGIIGRREHLLKDRVPEIVAMSSYTEIKVQYVVADVTKYDQISDAFEKLSGSLGNVDIFVSNAGFLPKPTPLREADDTEWWTTFETNVKGNFNAVCAFLKYAAPKPILISVNSEIAHLPVMPGYSAYAASKIATDLPGAFIVWLSSPEAKFLKGKFVWTNWDVDDLKFRAQEIMSSKDLELTLVGPAFRANL